MTWRECSPKDTRMSIVSRALRACSSANDSGCPSLALCLCRNISSFMWEISWQKISRRSRFTWCFFFEIRQRRGWYRGSIHRANSTDCVKNRCDRKSWIRKGEWQRRQEAGSMEEATRVWLEREEDFNALNQSTRYNYENRELKRTDAVGGAGEVDAVANSCLPREPAPRL